MMRKTVLWGCGLLLIGLVAWGIKMFNIYDNAFSNIYIFADIQECYALESVDNDGTFVKYQDTLKDEYSTGLSYTAFCSGKYQKNTCEFEIFAYTFDDTAIAREYFEKVSGKNSDTMDANFSLHSGIMHSQLVVFEKNKAYTISFPTSSLSNIAQIIEKYFTVKVV